MMKRMQGIRMGGRLAASLALLAVFSLTLTGQDSPALQGHAQSIAVVASPLAVEFTPAYGSPLSASAAVFSPGLAASLGLSYRLSGSILSIIGGLEYTYLPLLAEQSISASALAAGLRAVVLRAGALQVHLDCLGGGYYATYNDLSLGAFDPFVSGGLGVSFKPSQSFAVGVAARYEDYIGLYRGLVAGVGIHVPLGNLGGSVEIRKIELNTAFPVFYKHYDNNSIGKIQLESRLKIPATDIRISVYAKEFMDAPKSILVAETLQPGASIEAGLYALFNDKVLEITEGTKVAVEIAIEYKVEDIVYRDRAVETLDIQGRNAMTWDDDRKAAAFVNAKAPEVLDIARSVTSFIRSRETRSIPDNLLAAIALHETMDLYGINYTPNPVTPYSEASKQKTSIDFLQFPRETLKYKAGDCSDLSILYASLLQAIGVDTAFVTVPGHIFVAVNTRLSGKGVPDDLIGKGMFIDHAGCAWIPVEITLRHQGFLKAWQLGAKEWSESNAAGSAGFYPVQEAWTRYQPVGLPGSPESVALPQSDRILAAYMNEMQRCIEAAIGPRKAELEAEAAGGDAAKLNALGVLYAKYGSPDQAEQAFSKAISAKPYLPALVNLGNLLYQRGEWARALSYYGKANELAPNVPRIVLAIAKANRELQNYAIAQAGYEKLKSLDPQLAAQYAYLGSSDKSGGRAADIASMRSTVIWEGGE